MKLTIMERLLLLQILPAQASIATMRTVRELRKKLEFKDEEIKKYKIEDKVVKNPEGKQVPIVVWNNKIKEEPVDIKLVRNERTAILNRIEELDKDKQVSELLLNLYEKVKDFHEKLEKEG